MLRTVMKGEFFKEHFIVIPMLIEFCHSLYFTNFMLNLFIIALCVLNSIVIAVCFLKSVVIADCILNLIIVAVCVLNSFVMVLQLQQKAKNTRKLMDKFICIITVVLKNRHLFIDLSLYREFIWQQFVLNLYHFLIMLFKCILR